MRVFVTGASGWIGSALVPDLIGAGHRVVGLARSDTAASALTAAGAEVVRGDLDDVELLGRAAADADGVVHLAFKHDVAFAGDFPAAAGADRRVIEVIGDALTGSDRPFVIASGVLGLAPGRTATEADGLDSEADGPSLGGPEARRANAQLTVALASRRVRSSVVRLPPTCHGDGDSGFMAILVGVARAKGVSGYVGDGASRWPATHVLDAGHAFRLALEAAPAGSTLHAVAEEGVATRDIAEAIGRHLGIPAVSVAPEDAVAHFGFLGALLGVDSPASSEATRALLDWHPAHPGLLADLDQGHYFT